MTKRARLYTEMVTTGALLHGDVRRHLLFDSAEHPVALQVGGSDPTELARCTRLGQDWGYDEINLNCGCPSDRVQNGRFGACLMAEANLVRDCVAAMVDVASVPITVKHRIGIDHQESYAELQDFVGTVAEGGCQVFLVHARKAWLQGLSPKQNREVPPLNYGWVYQLKKDFPALTIVINGGIDSLEACDEHLKAVDGVMLGRAAYQRPWLLAQVDPALFNEPSPVNHRHQVIDAYAAYIERMLVEEAGHGLRLNHMTRHVLGLFQGEVGGKQFRRILSEQAHRPGANERVLLQATPSLQREAL